MAQTYGGYPDAAVNAAKRALRHRDEKGTSCGTSVGWQRANQIASREKLSLSTVKRTFSFLSRAKTYDQGKFQDGDGKDICGSIMYAAWGGDSMKSWAEGVIKKSEREMSTNSKEVRSLSSDFQIRSEADKKPVVEGYAVKFNDTTVIGGQFSESVDRSAFKNADMDNVVALFNHDWNMPLARTGHGLELEVDDVGVKYRFELGDQSYAKDLAENIRMGNVSTSSFGFTIKSDKWEKRDGMNHRTIMDVDKLYDVSPTTQGAYPTTEVALRSMEAALRSEDVSEEEEELAALASQEENVEQQHPVEEVAEAAVAEAAERAENTGGGDDMKEEEEEEEEKAEYTEDEEEDDKAEERVDILIDKSILPHPFALDEDTRNQTEPEAQTENTMSNSQETNAPAYIQGLGDSEARAASKFSFGKMIKEAAQGRLTGLEAEMNQEGRSEFSNGKVNVAGGICIPSYIVNRADAAPLGTATVTNGSAAFGGTIGTDDLGIVEAFAPRDIAAQLGVRNLTNLTGDVVFQVQANKMAAEIVAEGVGKDSTNASFSAVTLKPIRYSAHTKVTDQMLAQSAQDMGAFLAMDIRRAIDAKFNADIVAEIKAAAAANGTTPGTLNAYSENTGSEYNPMHLEEELLAADVDIQGLVSLSSAKAYRVFRELSHDAGSGLLFAQSPLERRNVIGYPTTISSSVTAGEFFMFHREQMITGTWGGLNLIIDPYSEADNGVTRIVANVYRDVESLQGAAFRGMQTVQ
jgi:HK97 family phage prohead protease/HK97 family phage major capsid protein